LQAGGCDLSWCYPIKNFIRKGSILFDEKGVKVFILKTVETGFWSGICNLLNLPNAW